MFNVKNLFFLVLSLLCIAGISLYSSKGQKRPYGLVESIEEEQEERNARKRLAEGLEGEFIAHVRARFPGYVFTEQEIRAALSEAMRLMPTKPPLTTEQREILEKEARENLEAHFPGQVFTDQTVRERVEILRYVGLATKTIIDNRKKQIAIRANLKDQFPDHVFTDEEILKGLISAQLHIATQPPSQELLMQSIRAGQAIDKPNQVFSDQEVREIINRMLPISTATSIIASQRGLTSTPGEQEHKAEREGKEHAQGPASEQPGQQPQ